MIANPAPGEASVSNEDELEFYDHEIVLDEIEDPELREAIERGLADIEAGRVVSHEEVVRWLQSWGTDHELPPPKCP